MAQKTKVKELVGRGLNSYHTKSLQQIDRIEKKNKEQNHKISILSNELDNDYLTKTEEGSVISLEHSKEGMIYLDELQGNTLVNYCTDGSKEMTLNGDIDVEGTFVTTTEGVDNGKVDVMCEGNTLVNLKYGAEGNDCNMSWADSGTIEYFNRQEYSKIHCKGEIIETANNLGISWIYHIMGQIKLHLLKTNTTYTIKLNNKYDCINGIYIQAGNATNQYLKESRKIDKDTYLITTKDSFEGLSTNGIILYGSLSKDYKGNVDYKIIGILEGDWTNREFPTEFFEGMKSVGQDDTNGHKIEILSKNKNLFNPEEVYESGYSFGVPFVNSVKCQEKDGVFTRVTSANTWNAGIGFHVKTEKNKDYTLSVGEYFNDGVNMDIRCIGVYKSEYPFENNNNMQSYANRIVAKNLDSNNNSLTYNSKNYDYILFYIGGQWNENANGVKTFRMSKIEVNQSSTKPTNYTKQNLNKKEILLNEPLRGLPNGIKDRKIKIGGKWYIERNCKEVILNGSENWIEANQNDWGSSTIYSVYLIDLNNFKAGSYVISDKFPSLGRVANTRDITNEYITGFEGNHTFCILGIKMDKLSSNSVSSFKTWLQSNPIKVIYELATPIYEPLEVEPTLNTYNDVTHISNNSIIPANMKIQNTGYNAIIKPSTLYTVALDTNKSGTVGMNLGGAKGTTTNNVATITTPATLTNDSLRLYGKGIKGSKIRLLEGDKTNWIPSYFEGMKSSFEDKLQEDGSYKMEILSNNKNLLGLDFYSNEHRVVSINGATREINGNTFKVSNNNSTTMDCFAIHLYDLRKALKKSGVYTLSFDILERTGGYDAGIYLIRYLESSFTGGYIPLKHHSLASYKPGDRVFIQFDYLNYSLEEICFRLNVNSPNSSVKIGNIQIEEGTTTSNYIPQKSNKIQFSSIKPLRKLDKFVFKDNMLMVERNNAEKVLNGTENWSYDTSSSTQEVGRFGLHNEGMKGNRSLVICDKYAFKTNYTMTSHNYEGTFTSIGGNTLYLDTMLNKLETKDLNGFKKWLSKNPVKVVYELVEPVYEEIPFELQKIILEGYENGTLFFDTNIPPTSTVRYAGETPIVKSVKLNKTEVLNNTNNINDNIIPYLMDMDYRVVCLQLQSEEFNDRVAMARLFGGTYEMLQRDIQSKRYSVDEYKHRLDAYLDANKITEEEYNKLGGMLNE